MSMFESNQAAVLWRLEHFSETERRQADCRVGEAARALAGAMRVAVRMIQLDDRIPARQ
jgi:hypothetical protein